MPFTRFSPPKRHRSMKPIPLIDPTEHAALTAKAEAFNLAHIPGSHMTCGSAHTQLRSSAFISYRAAQGYHVIAQTDLTPGGISIDLLKPTPVQEPTYALETEPALG